MSLLTKRSRFALPLQLSELFGPMRVFDDLMDFDGDLLNFDMAVRIPSVNITESDKDFKIELAAPGLERKDFKVEVDDRVLSISAEKEEEKKDEKENYSRREYSFNSFSRSFRLPENALADKIDAHYENGILKMILPKKEVKPLKPKKEIKVS